MTPPVLITPPSAPVVGLVDLKAHLRVDFDDDDALIAALETAAVAHLDGWQGVLGRAILPQVWRQEFEAGECPRLAMPDVSEIEATGYDGAGGVVAVTATLQRDLRGAWVEVTGNYHRLQIDFTCGLSAQKLPAAQAAVKMMVGHWYANREAVVTGTIASEIPMAVDALIGAMRWMDM